MSDFDWNFYTNHYSDLRIFPNKESAFQHWILFGKKEGRICNCNELKKQIHFDWNFYTNHYSDLRIFKNEESAFQHWIIFGKNEGRICKE